MKKLSMHSFLSSIKRTSAVLAWLLSGLWALLLSEGAWAAGACSPSLGLVTLNEYNYIDNFTEINKVNPAVDLSGWTVTIYTSSKATVKALPATGSNSCFGGRYQVSTFASNEIGTDADVVLKDGAGDVVDILRVRTSLPVTTPYYGAKPACSFAGNATDLVIAPGSKAVDRMPDGVGDWRQTPGTGSNSFQSRCGPNIVGGSADLSVGKTVNLSTVVRGSPVTFTVLVVNNAGDTARSVLVSDLLPAGLGYVSSTVSSGSYSPATGVWTIGDMVVNGSATLTLTATTTVVGTLSNTATVAASTFDPATANNTAAVSVVVTSPGATLDAVEVTAAAGTAIKTKLAGKGFNLDILALAADASIATSYNKSVTIELVDASTGVCSSMSLLQSVGTYTFTGPGAGKDNGRKTYSFNYPNAARNVRVRLKDNSATPITACSTDNFAIRPDSLSFTATDGDWESAGTARTLNNVSTSGGTVHKAGRPFTITVTGYNGASTPAITTRYDGAPTASIAAHIIPTSCLSGTGCTLTGGAFTDGTANDGRVSSASASYAEVGAFNLQLTDTSFADVDAGDSTIGERYITSGTVAVGRFVPDHFALTSGSRTPACTTGGAVLSYMGQPFTLAATVVAQNFAGSITGNYSSSSGGYAPAAVVWQAENADSGTNLNGAGARLTNAAGAWSNGTYLINSTTATFTRLGSPDGPYDTLQLGVRLTDPDGPVLGGLDMNATTSGACAPCTAKMVGAPLSVRFGRLRLFNAYGSELLDLPMPVQTQFWNGTAFVTNSDDNCTSLTGSSIGLGNYQKNLNSGETGVSPATVSFVSGIGNMKLTRPGSGNSGSVDLCLDLGPDPGGGTACAATSANLPFLQGKWPPGANWNNDPTARATFGVYKSPLIYRRENY